jgi:mannose-6-phosphate isomerase-like protein (cupin superfamily)
MVGDARLLFPANNAHSGKHSNMNTPPPIEEIRHGELLLAIIIRASFERPGLHFFTPDDFSQQLAYMHHPPGKVIDPHVHNPVPRAIQMTQEVLVVRRGKVRVDFYDNEKNYLKSRVLDAGDIILLAAAGHGFEVLEDLEMIEIKQGPYAGYADKVRFAAVDKAQVNFNR